MILGAKPQAEDKQIRFLPKTLNGVPVLILLVVHGPFVGFNAYI